MQESAGGAAAGMKRLSPVMILVAAISFALASSARADVPNLRIAAGDGSLLVDGPFVAFTPIVARFQRGKRAALRRADPAAARPGRTG